MYIECLKNWRNSDHGLIWFMNVSIVSERLKKKMKRLKMRYIPTVVVAFSCDFVVANPILIKKQVSNGISNNTLV